MAHVSEELRLVLACFRDLAALVLDIVEQPHVAPALMSSKLRCGRALLRPSPLCARGTTTQQIGWLYISNLVGSTSQIWLAHHAPDLRRVRQPSLSLGRDVRCTGRRAGPSWVLGLADLQGSRIWNSRGIPSRDLRRGRGSREGSRSAFRER
jgi:hypothetical protein